MRSIRSLLVAAAIAVLPAGPAQAENLDLLMSRVFSSAEAVYIGYESVTREDIPKSADVYRKYLIVDFRFNNEQPSGQRLQASVHQVCKTLLQNRPLIHSLSEAGYDMVSVAFDQRSQFDCL